MPTEFFEMSLTELEEMEREHNKLWAMVQEWVPPTLADLDASDPYGTDEIQDRLCCSICNEPTTFKPSHDGSPRCESGSIASGGQRSHCTCDTCF